MPEDLCYSLMESLYTCTATVPAVPATVPAAPATVPADVPAVPAADHLLMTGAAKDPYRQLK